MSGKTVCQKKESTNKYINDTIYSSKKYRNYSLINKTQINPQIYFSYNYNLYGSPGLHTFLCFFKPDQFQFLYFMSHIIELEVTPDSKQAYDQQSKAKQRNGCFKIKRVLSLFFSSNLKNNKVKVHKNANQFEGYTEMPPFYYVYSFLTKISYKEHEKHLRLKSLPLCDGKPFTIPMKNVKIAGIHNLIKYQNQFPDLILSLDMNSGQIIIKNSVFYAAEFIKEERLLLSIVNKMFESLTLNNDKFMKIFKQMSNDFQIVKKPSSHQDTHSKTMDSISKYLKLSFIDMQFSDTGIFRHRKENSNQIFQTNIFKAHVAIQLEQYNVRKTLSLFQILQPDKNQSLENIMLPALQVKDLFILLRFPKPKVRNQKDNQFIFNEIKILNPQKIQLVNSNFKGGTGQLWKSILQFQYPFQTQKQIKQKCKQHITNRNLEKPVLIKTPIDKNTAKFIQHEIKILKTMENSNSAYLIKYYQTNQKNSNLYGKLIMDNASNCQDLQVFIQKNKQTSSIVTKFLILSNIANGLRFLKSHKVVHMDLAPKNILIGQGFLTKIIDFGESFCQSVCGQNYRPGFTNPYGPPEVFDSTKIFTVKQDIFSFGMILFKMIMDQFPFRPTQKLITNYRNKTYNQKIFFALESLDYTWLSQPMLLVFSLFVRCKSLDPFYRPDPAWIRVILKLLSDWYRRQPLEQS